jgi:KRAB domain-containing zinc finger protein
MKQHRERMHLGVKYPCNGCSYQATDKSHLRRHKQRVHHGLKYSCEQCGQFYSDMSTLKRHIRNLHTTEKKVFVCDACDFRSLEAGFPV